LEGNAKTPRSLERMKNMSDHRSSIFHSVFEPYSSKNARTLTLALRSASGPRRTPKKPKTQPFPLTIYVTLARIGGSMLSTQEAHECWLPTSVSKSQLGPCMNLEIEWRRSQVREFAHEGPAWQEVADPHSSPADLRADAQTVRSRMPRRSRT